MVNDPVLAMHAQEAPFLWGARDRAVREAHYTLEALVRLDDRLHAHLEGLQVDSATGWRHARSALASIDAGVVFMVGALAFRGDSPEQVRDAFAAASAWPDGHRPLVSALAWHDDASARRWSGQLIGSSAAEHRRVAIDALRLLRCATPAQAIHAVADANPVVRASGARAAGECRLAGTAAAMHGLLGDGDSRCRFWAAWSLTLLDAPDGLSELMRLCEEPPWAWRAVQLVLRALPLERGREVVRRLTAKPGARKLAIAATGILGDPQAIPWLLAQMEDPDLARMAGEAFSSITGVDLVRDDLSEDAEEDGERTATGDEACNGDAAWIPPNHEDSLPRPNVEMLKRWSDQGRTGLRPGQRHLCGQPVSTGQALQVLKAGRQRDRAAAALELALLQPGTALFDVLARARLQRRRMASWNS